MTRAQEALKAVGKEITVNNLREVLGPKEYSNLATQFRNTLPPEKKLDFGGCLHGVGSSNGFGVKL